MTRSQITILGIAGFIVLVIGLILLGVIPGLRKPPAPPTPVTTINFWGLESDREAWEEVITNYTASRQNIAVTYKGISEAQYETNLLDNLAAGTGPDVFLLRHDWLSKHRNKVSTAPDYITAAKIGEIFPRAVAEDFVSENKVYALPISMNTLALAYNRDYFDAKGVGNPPQNWTEIRNMIPRLRELRDGKIAKSAIALGSSDKNINNASDILTLLMLQGKVEFFGGTNDKPRFIETGGASWLKFYLDFSDPKNASFAYYEGTNIKSLDEFAAGNIAMTFIYPEDLAYIKSKNQVMNVKVVAMPQVDVNNPMNIVDYWGLAVSNQSRNYDLAWDFINFTTANPAAVEVYVRASGNAPALRSEIAKYQNDPVLSVFAPQVLNARSFPEASLEMFRTILNDMVESTLKDRASINANALNAARRFNALGR